MFATIARIAATAVLIAAILLSVQACSLLAGPGGQPAAQGSAPTTTAPVATPAAATSPSSASAAAASPATASGVPLTQTTQGFATAIRQVADAVRPAVVQITSSQQALDVFSQSMTQQTGVGSGVIYDDQGHILTNNHVVEGADKLTVSLPDGRSFDGKVVGTDPDTDLAVVQIQGTNLPVAQLGDSSQLQVGDWVVAIGNALALPGGPTVTAGVVSALNRTVQEPPSQTTGQAGPFLYDVIQTDASINPGNSGGALVNLQGQVVGINSLIAGTAEPGVQAQGIGFAIGMNTVKPIAQQLVTTGKASHPFIGISYSALTPSIARRLGVPRGPGIVVAQVLPGSPAATAGLKAGDVIQSIDGQKITDESTLGQVLFTHKVGDMVTLEVQRGSQTLRVQVTLEEKPTQ